MDIDARFTISSGREVFTGGQLLLKGALEATGGVHLLTGHRCAPWQGFFDALDSMNGMLGPRGVKVRPAASEALAAGLLTGCQSSGGRAVAAMSSTGFAAALEALASAMAAGVPGEGGAVVAIAEDPWGQRTPMPGDSRFLAQHLRMPLLEPATPQEVKDFVDLAARLSRAGGVPIGMLVSVEAAGGGGSVNLRANCFPEDPGAKSPERRPAERRAISPWNGPELEQKLIEAHLLVLAESRRVLLSRIENRPQRGEKLGVGFIAAGWAYAQLTQALVEIGLAGRVPVLKLGMSYPVDDRLVMELAESCERLVVIEERRSFVEMQVRAIVSQLPAGQVPEVWGKRFPGELSGTSTTGGLYPSLLIERLVPLLRAHLNMAGAAEEKIADQLARIERAGKVKLTPLERPATFCAGCPHRDSTSMLSDLRLDLRDVEYMSRSHRRTPVELIVHGDWGCSSLLMNDAHLGETAKLSPRALGGAAAGGGAGGSGGEAVKNVVMLGDGALFHSGLASIRHSIAAGDDVTYILLDNHTAAMTGRGAVEPESGVGSAASAQRIVKAIKAMHDGGHARRLRVIQVNPEDRSDYRAALERAILAEGVKVVVSEKACALLESEKRKRTQVVMGSSATPALRESYTNIDPEVCENCLQCTVRTGCPGLMRVETDYGPKVQTDLGVCVNDGACARLEVCPAFERVTVIRYGQRRAVVVDRYEVPDAPPPVHAQSEVWRCCVAGVGGTGVETVGRVLAAAGRRMGYHVLVTPVRDAAVRTGTALCEVSFTRDPKRVVSGIIPQGGADLLVAMDLLEGARAIDGSQRHRVADPQQTAAVLNTTMLTPTAVMMGREEVDPTLTKRTTAVLRSEWTVAADFAELAERYLGGRVMMNVMMLGVAYQRGLLPLSLASVEEAIAEVLGGEGARNVRALQVGRSLAAGQLAGIGESEPAAETAAAAVRRKAKAIARWHRGARGRAVALEFVRTIRGVLRAMRSRGVPSEVRREMVVRAGDCVIWGGPDYAKRYCRRVMGVLERDSGRGGRGGGMALTRAVVWNLAKVMLIKDEVYVAAMLRSPEKRRRDVRRFGVRPELGERISYTRQHRPEFALWGRRWSFPWASRGWQLSLLGRLRVLRVVWPGWHKREVAYREWYEQLVDRCEPRGEKDYEKWVAVLSTPEVVRGYRDVRWPAIEAAKAAAESLLNQTAGEGTGEAKITVSLSGKKG